MASLPVRLGSSELAGKPCCSCFPREVQLRLLIVFAWPQSISCSIFRYFCIRLSFPVVIHHTLPAPTRHMRERTPTREKVRLFRRVFLRLSALMVCLQCPIPRLLLFCFVFNFSPCAIILPLCLVCGAIRNRNADISFAFLC